MTMVASARTIHKARQGDTNGFKTGDITVDYDRIRGRMNTIQNESSEGLEKWMDDAKNVTLIKEWGVIIGPK
jgi:pyruvate/2-oxoglutarate dehydrogenase complex dihydrolipoamide dehydrogenase (E3) component